MQIKKIFEKFLIFSPLVFLLFIIIYVSAATIELSNTPDVNLYTTDGTVNSIVTDSENDKIYIGGDFSYVGPYAGKAVVVDLDTGVLINAGLDITGSVYAAISDGKGGLYIGGDFTAINGYNINTLAHINSDYTLDTNFSFDISGVALALYFYNNTDLYVGGDFVSINGSTASNLILIDANKNLLNSDVYPDISGSVFSLLGVAEDLYIGGGFNSVNTVPTKGIAKMSLNTKVFDENFSINPTDGAVYALIQDGPFIYFAGDFEKVGELSISKLGRFMIEDAKFDSEFSIDTNDINAIKSVVMNEQDIYLGGDFSIKNDSIKNLAKVDRNTLFIDSNFNYDLDGTVNKMLIQDDYLYAVGKFGNINSPYIIKIKIGDGTIDGSFHPNPNDSINTIVSIEDNIFLGGAFNRICGESISNLARIDSITGIVDRNFNLGVNGAVNTMALANDSLYIGGDFLEVNGSASPYLAKINNQTGESTKDFSVSLNAPVKTLIAHNNNLYIGGEFELKLLVVDALTGEKSLSSEAVLDGPVYSMAMSENGLYVGGNFTNKIALIDLNTGAFVNGFKANVNGIVNAISVDDDAMYIGGDFLQVDGSASPYLAKINNQTGELIKDFSVFPDASVKTLMLHRDNLYVGGTFSQIGSKNISGLAKIDISTEESGVDDAFVINPDGGVNALGINDNNLYVGGDFSFVGAYRTPSFASFSWLDKTPPVITIIGESNVSIEQNSLYQDPGAMALDNNNQDITSLIVTSGLVNTAIPGSYIIRYSVTDSSGRTSTIERNVEVIKSTTSSGGGLPPEASLAPINPKPTENNPDGKLNFIINKNEKITYSNLVTLQFFANSDVSKLAISEDKEFKNASLDAYSETKQIKLSEDYGEKTVYVKFYTKYGVSSDPISKTIVFAKENISPVVIQEIKQSINSITRDISSAKAIIIAKPVVSSPSSTLSQDISLTKEIKANISDSVDKIEKSKNLIEKSITNSTIQQAPISSKTKEVKKIVGKIDSNIKEIKNVILETKNSEPIKLETKEKIEKNLNDIKKNTQAIEVVIKKSQVSSNGPHIVVNNTKINNQNNKENKALKTINSFIRSWKGFLGKIFR